MALLFDAHVVVWFMQDNTMIPEQVYSLIRSDSGPAYISICSIWELKIKHNLGKLILDKPFEVLINIVNESKFALLDLSVQHITQLDSLPNLHKDPFNRILIAQAIHENLTIITKDEIFHQYPVKTFWR